MKDLYHQDVVEMIERETRQYSIWSIEDPASPDFDEAYKVLHGAFGRTGEMERKEVIAGFLSSGPFRTASTGTFIKYFLLVVKDKNGVLCGVRDGTVLLNPAYAPDLCVVYLSHIYMLPHARGTVMSYWLRIAPIEIAVQHMAELHAQGKISLPAPGSPGKYFGMQINLAAEMEYFTPEERPSWERILFYGRGGFDAINPRHFPYRQPDFRDPEVIRVDGNMPVPFVLLVRRMGRERQATLPIREAQAIMRLIYDDFATHCEPAFLANSLELVLRRLEERAQRKSFVELLPLPTSSKDLHRLKKLFRYHVYTRYYPDAPETRRYLDSGIREALAKNPRYLEDAIAKIAEELDRRPHYVYGNRDKGFTWEGAAVPAGEERTEAEDDQRAEAYGSDGADVMDHGEDAEPMPSELDVRAENRAEAAFDGKVEPRSERKPEPRQERKAESARADARTPEQRAAQRVG
ncbi:MAG: hypothetical protein HUU21_20015 [Polyangiaceae bacterium]|nr:hypothetical protein [Polyangiaceae bacterium]